MRYFRIKNFEQFQHYKDRSPPWIKLYNDLLDNYEFACLQDASKLHLVMIWLLASRHENRLPFDPEWIGKRINATEPVNLKILENHGFLIAERDDIEALAECEHGACPETEQSRAETEEISASRDFPIRPGAWCVPVKGNGKAHEAREVYLTAKKRKLSGWKLDAFLRFWTAFAYPKDKARAADAWLDIEGLTLELSDQIVEKATLEAKARQSLIKRDQTPIYAQGWLTARRWEDEVYGVPEPHRAADPPVDPAKQAAQLEYYRRRGDLDKRAIAAGLYPGPGTKESLDDYEARITQSETAKRDRSKGQAS